MFKGNIAQAMQMAQRMQDNMKKAQDELASLEVTGSAGGGLVSVTLSGKFDARKVHVDPQALGDAEMLEETPGMPGVLTSDEIGGTDRLDRPEGDVAEISDRCGDQLNRSRPVRRVHGGRVLTSRSPNKRRVCPRHPRPRLRGRCVRRPGSWDPQIGSCPR